MSVPHRVRYVFPNFEEAVEVECSCDHDQDHLDVYPFYDEVVVPVLRRMSHRIRSRFRKDHPQ